MTPPDDATTVRAAGSRGTGARRGVPAQGRPEPRRVDAGAVPAGADAPGRRRAPLALSAAATTGWAATVSLAPVLAVVVGLSLASGGDPGAAMLLRVALGGWLLAHGVDLQTGLGPIGLAPLTVSALAAWRVVRAGVHTTRAIGGRRSRSWRLVGLAGLGVAVVYGLLGAVAAGAASGPGLQVPMLRAGLTFAAFGLLAALVGAVRESGLHEVLARRTPPVLRDAVRTGVVAALLVLGAGAAAAGTAVAVSGSEASGVLASYRTGVAGQAGLTLLCLLYAPDLAVWAASYLIGPGFAFGTGSTVSAAQVTLGDLPSVPVLAGLPAGPAGGWGALLLGVPLAGGMAAGWLLARRRLGAAEPADGGARASSRARASSGARVSSSGGNSGVGEAALGWLRLVGAAALAGPVAGGALGLAALAAAGPLGADRLAVTGAAAGPVAAGGAGLVAVGAVIAAAATRGLIGVRGNAR